MLPPGSVVSVWPLADPDLSTKLWTDGVLGTAIWPGQRVDVRISDYMTKIYLFCGRIILYYGTLRNKLHWGPGGGGLGSVLRIIIAIKPRLQSHHTPWFGWAE